MAEPGEKERLRELEDRIAGLKKTQAPGPTKEEHYSQVQQGWRMVIELVAGIGIGVVIGLGLDAIFGFAPLGLIVFTLLGFVAGVRTMMRTAAEMQNDTHGAAKTKPADNEED